MGKLRDLLGLKFANLTVVSREPNDANNKAVWKCVCDCGEFRVVTSNDLTRGKVKSCGCLSRKCDSTGKGNSKHKLYNVWSVMKQRCHNSNSNSYRYYGARGIQVCERWRSSFANFLEDMGERPEGMTLDRINNDSNYCPENCRWATVEQNNVNRGKRKTGSNKYKGVYWKENLKKWVARIGYKGECLHLGCFVVETDAAIAYNEKAKELFGEWAFLNIIE